VFLFLASFLSVAKRFLLFISAYGKISKSTSGPPGSPRGSDAQVHLTAFENSSLCVTGSVQRSVLQYLHRGGVQSLSIIALDEFLFL